ncbi:MAG: acyl-CoA/acyl-ACP dehydrogenase [Symploca sp. SIO2D2]|nr:acyl-CoA/acyl-ACP dehydrogenase [Symploca sp. SIO2D2]
MVADRGNRLPNEGLTALNEAGLMNVSFSGNEESLGLSVGDFASIISKIGEHCLSTAFIYLQHCQQLALLKEHVYDSQRELVEEIIESGEWIGSVTTQKEKGGDLLRVNPPLVYENDMVRVRREAPVVGYAEAAGWFLVTMRTGVDSPENQVSLVAIHKSDLGVSIKGEWNALGMRGTQSLPMNFNVQISKERVIKADFRMIALKTMIPFAHVGWAASWYGGARGVYDRFLDTIKRDRKCYKSELFRNRMASIRLELDQMKAFLDSVTRDLDEARERNVDLSFYGDPTFNIKINNLKIGLAKSSFKVVSELIEYMGLARGYFVEDEHFAERVFRDLKAAALLYHNDRLLEANGKLMLIEGRNLFG